MLRSRGYFRFRDYSVPRNDPIHAAPDDLLLQEAIRRKMKPCGVVLVLGGVYATYSKWIKEEIDLASHGFARSKPILAVRPRGNRRISRPVRDAAQRIVNWNTESIVSAVRELS